MEKYLVVGGGLFILGIVILILDLIIYGPTYERRVEKKLRCLQNSPSGNARPYNGRVYTALTIVGVVLITAALIVYLSGQGA